MIGVYVYSLAVDTCKWGLRLRGIAVMLTTIIKMIFIILMLLLILILISGARPPAGSCRSHDHEGVPRGRPPHL